MQKTDIDISTYTVANMLHAAADQYAADNATICADESLPLESKRRLAKHFDAQREQASRLARLIENASGGRVRDDVLSLWE
jgi:hypothetical protein